MCPGLGRNSTMFNRGPPLCSLFFLVKFPIQPNTQLEAKFIVSVVKLNFGHNFQVFGHLPHDCDEGLLLALTGFFTDMALSWFLDRPVIYTPLKICSIYAGIIGACATAAGTK